jgi:protein phosphatase
VKQVAFGLSDVGRCRENNQDNMLVEPQRGLYAVADGMGGHAAGEVASQMAISTLAESLAEITGDLTGSEAGRRLEQALQEGNRRICEAVLSRGEWRGMGTTIVALVALGDTAVIGHVGDSRAYLLRNGELRRLTSDHSWVNEQVKLGLLSDEEAQRHPMRNIVTRALGNRPDLQVELSQHTVREGDVILLCSDGLNTMLSDEEIRERLLGHPADPQAACRNLIESANARGGEDNVTVIVFAALNSGPRS